MTRPEHVYATLLGIVMILVGLHPCDPVHAQDWTDREVALAKLCANEATFREIDCVAITEARGRYTVIELRSMHRRAFAVGRTDSRRWIETLNADATMPIGWPERLVPWESRGKALWLNTLRTVRATLRGERHACGGQTPSIWGGKIDAAHIRRRIEQGWVVLACPGAANTFMRRGSR